MRSEENTPLILCRSGCGFYGSPSTQDLCSKCFREKQKQKEELVEEMRRLTIFSPPSTNTAAATEETKSAKPARCARCNKKVGLLKGFTCRCGDMFCSAHRHAEEHSCTFDYKAVARAALIKNNPRVAPDKLQRI